MSRKDIKDIKDIDIIDLHMHSDHSDGTDTPSGILEVALQHGFDLFSLTDHDAISGCADIMAELSAMPEGPGFITGIEFSCKDELGKYHILGYGYDMNRPGIKNVVEKGHRLRMEKVNARLDFIKEEFGFEFSWEDIAELISLENPGKPHIANLMVKYGYAKTKEEAIRDYINKRKFGNEYIRPEEAIEGILSSNGIPVLAHPSYGSGDELIMGQEMEERIKRLMDFGLQGLEGYYSGFTPRLESEILGFADRFRLFVTAGSDYHGRNKLVTPGQTNLEHVRGAAPGLKRFLQNIASKII